MDPSLTSPNETAHVNVEPGATSYSITTDLTALIPEVTYYYRLVGTNVGGIAKGSIDYFALYPNDNNELVVNCPDDYEHAPPGKITLREALNRLAPGGRISFDPALNGTTIRLNVVGSIHSMLEGEVFIFNQDGWQFLGFQQRDYGRSAIYADKDIIVDASALPDGITIKWEGNSANHARVLSVYGDLTMTNVAITGGNSVSEPIVDSMQPYTLARGGGLAVWGEAALVNCILSGNKVEGDEEPSRDRGSFGGGIYAEIMYLDNCIISGNSVKGFGAAGGGIYAVGSSYYSENSTISRCSVTGNRVTGQHAYGGGIYSDGGGPGRSRSLTLTNCTIAQNLVADNPGIDEIDMFQYYYRGGGIYMSNGYLSVKNCTIAENEVIGYPTEFNSKPNMGGGGIAATIGNAHVVEKMEVQHSIIIGNKVNGTANDLFSGSLIEFCSYGYNLIGKIDFSQILVPIPAWEYLSRKHWPKVGDQHGVKASDVLALDNIRYHDSIESLGTDRTRNIVLWYPPSGVALDRIPDVTYRVEFVKAGYDVIPEGIDDFLVLLLEKLRTDFSDVIGNAFGTELDDPSGIFWYETIELWPSDPLNIPWINFWRDLDDALGDLLGPAQLGDEFWGSFSEGLFGENIEMSIHDMQSEEINLIDYDQIGNARPFGLDADIGAIELIRIQ